MTDVARIPYEEIDERVVGCRIVGHNFDGGDHEWLDDPKRDFPADAIEAIESQKNIRCGSTVYFVDPAGWIEVIS